MSDDDHANTGGHNPFSINSGSWYRLGKHLDDTDVRQTSTLQVALTLVTLVTLVTLALISKCYPCSSRWLWHSFLWNRTMCQAKKYITDTHVCEARSENLNYLQPIVSLQSSLSSSIHQEPNCPQTIVHCNNHCTSSVGNVLAIVEQAPRVALGMWVQGGDIIQRSNIIFLLRI